MKNKKHVIGGIVLLGIIIIGAVILNGREGEKVDNELQNQEVSTDDPIDIVMDFYNPWLEAARSSESDPYALGLQNNPLLSKELKEAIDTAASRPLGEIDPVLCQNTFPERVAGRMVSQYEDIARVLVTARQSEITAQSTFTLKRHNDGWYIDAIECAPGEFDIPREFTFDREGYLLKSVPPPLNSDYWHLVFEDNGQLGHTAPLFFNDESMCTISGNESTCNPDSFREATKAYVRGQMTELGVEVKRVDIE